MSSVLIEEKQPIKVYADGRPAPRYRLQIKDHGIVLRSGDGPAGCDRLGAREASVYKADGQYYLHYDGAGPEGWLACLAVSSDLKNWKKRGPALSLGAPGTSDSATATSPWVIEKDGKWHMFYLGSPNAGPGPEYVPAFPYLTLKATADSPQGPWVKQPDVIPFGTVEGTYRESTASPGFIVEHNDEYLQFFSASVDTYEPGQQNKAWALRTLALARTKDLDAEWQVDAQPILPLEEQIENSSVYYDKKRDLWFLFTNHIGCEVHPDHGFIEYTDAVWVYWSKDPYNWNPENKAVVVDGESCNWSKKCIGMPSVVDLGDELAILYDAPGGDSVSHMNRHIGLAILKLPVELPVK